MKKTKEKRLGVILMITGILLILLAALFKSSGIPDIFLGFWTGPLFFIAGGVILLRDKE